METRWNCVFDKKNYPEYSGGRNTTNDSYQKNGNYTVREKSIYKTSRQQRTMIPKLREKSNTYIGLGEEKRKTSR